MWNFFLVTIAGEDGDGIPVIIETFLFKTQTAESEVGSKFLQVFDSYKRGNRDAQWFQVKHLKNGVPAFVNERMVPRENFWPLSEIGGEK